MVPHCNELPGLHTYNFTRLVGNTICQFNVIFAMLGACAGALRAWSVNVLEDLSIAERISRVPTAKVVAAVGGVPHLPRVRVESDAHRVANSCIGQGRETLTIAYLKQLRDGTNAQCN